jgi:hypothetical protein
VEYLESYLQVSVLDAAAKGSYPALFGTKLGVHKRENVLKNKEPRAEEIDEGQYHENEIVSLTYASLEAIKA